MRQIDSERGCSQDVHFANAAKVYYLEADHH